MCSSVLVRRSYLFKGQKLQPGLMAGPYPPGLTIDDIDKLGVRMTPCGSQTLETLMTARTRLLLTEYICKTFIDNHPSLAIAEFEQAGLLPYNPDIVLKQCRDYKPAAPVPGAAAVDDIVEPIIYRTVHGDLQRIRQKLDSQVRDDAEKMRDILQICQTAPTPRKVLPTASARALRNPTVRTSLHDGRAPKVPGQRRFGNDAVHTFADLRRLLNIEPQALGAPVLTVAPVAVPIVDTGAMAINLEAGSSGEEADAEDSGVF